MRLSEIAKMLELNVSTTSRLLHSLERYGLVHREPVSGRYLLGYKLLHMAHVVQEQMGIADIAAPILEKLVVATNETATVNILHNDRAMVVARVPCSNQLRIVVPVGTLSPLYCTAAGKSLLAYRSDEEIERILALGMPRRTSLTITDPGVMREELAHVRSREYAIDRGEREEGLIGISAPVLNAHGTVIATCGLSGAGQRMTEERMPELARHVVAAAEDLSALLVFHSELVQSDTQVVQGMLHVATNGRERIAGD